MYSKDMQVIEFIFRGPLSSYTHTHITLTEGGGGEKQRVKERDRVYEVKVIHTAGCD